MRASYQLGRRTPSSPVSGRQHAKAAVGLLVDADVVWEDHEEVKLALDEAEGPFRWREILQVAETACRKLLVKRDPKQGQCSVDLQK